MSKSFDLQTHHYDRQGKIVRANEYRLVINNGKREFERPVGSGLWYAEDGSLLRDESGPLKAAQAEREALAAKQAEEAKQAEYEALRAKMRAEFEAEKKEAKHGARSTP